MKPALIVAIMLAVIVHLAPGSKAEEQPSKIQAKVQRNTPPSLTISVQNHETENHDQARNDDAPHWYETSEWILIIITGVTAGFICWQAWESRRAVREMGRQTNIANRAYLRVGEPSWVGTTFQFPVENYGHIAGHIVSVFIEMIVREGDVEVERMGRTIATRYAVVPGIANEVAICVTLNLDRSREYVVAGTITYDTGFRDMDTMTFTRVFHGQLLKWAKAATIIEINFASPDEADQKKEPN